MDEERKPVVENGSMLLRNFIWVPVPNFPVGISSCCIIGADFPLEGSCIPKISRRELGDLRKGVE